MTKASLDHQALFDAYSQRCAQDGLLPYADKDFVSLAYLARVIAHAKGEGLPAGWVPTTTYFYIEAGAILGAIRLRHGTDEYIKYEIGHIGYETSSHARGRGVATKMLDWVLNNVVEGAPIVICDEDNLASRKVIEKCAGRYLETVYSKAHSQYITRYQFERQR
ncbi:MAG: GNAT family N-acetyltransferase [Pseudomonadales bacterium]